MMHSSIEKSDPIFSKSTAARLLKISVHTLRMYEREYLIILCKKKSNQRLYSQAVLDRIQCIRDVINQVKSGIKGNKTIYSLIPCWDKVKCSEEDQKKCDVFNGAHEPCCMLKHKNNVYETKNCRDYDVYSSFGDSESIKVKRKELIARSSK